MISANSTYDLGELHLVPHICAPRIVHMRSANSAYALGGTSGGKWPQRSSISLLAKPRRRPLPRHFLGGGDGRHGQLPRQALGANLQASVVDLFQGFELCAHSPDIYEARPHRRGAHAAAYPYFLSETSLFLSSRRKTAEMVGTGTRHALHVE